jgi:polysaccharide export outer membrane protein
MWKNQRATCVRIGVAVLIVCVSLATANAQSRGAGAMGGKPPAKPELAVELPPNYKIGVDDVLAVIFLDELKSLTADVAVRPDGKISLPLINDIQAEGLTTDELRLSITKAATKFVAAEPNVTVEVKQINSRRVFITGQVGKPGQYPLTAHMTVIQLIAVAGGMPEYADKEHIVVLRTENGLLKSYTVNYDQITQPKPKNLQQNIELKPGDTVVIR